MQEIAYVYILASSFQKLYIGVTSEIEVRIEQHKSGKFSDSHTSRYKIDKLVYLERFTTITAAIAREKQLKRWSRIKKIRLIVAANPTWHDLSAEWGKASPALECQINPLQKSSSYTASEVVISPLHGAVL